MKLSNVVEEFLWTAKAEGKSGNTIASYKVILKMFNEFVEDQEITDITPLMFKQFMAWDLSRTRIGDDDKKLSDETVRKHFTVLRTFFNWCELNEICSNVTQRIKKPTIHEKEFDVLSDDEIKRIYRLISTNYDTLTAVRNRTIVDLFLGTGLRLNEVATTTLDDISFDEFFIEVVGKGNKQARVPFEPALGRTLYNYIHRHRNANSGVNNLFVTSTGEAMSRRGIQIMIKRLLTDAEVDGKKGPHTFRHTFATRYLLAGGSVEGLRKILRHSDLSVIMKYLHFADQNVREEQHQISPLARIRRVAR